MLGAFQLSDEMAGAQLLERMHLSYFKFGASQRYLINNLMHSVKEFGTDKIEKAEP